MASSTSTLSVRGQHSTASGAAISRIMKVLKESYSSANVATGIIPLNISENYQMHKEVADRINKTFEISPHAVGYGDGPAGSIKLKSLALAFLNDTLKPATPIEDDHLIFVSGVTSACEMCAFTLLDAGDGVLLGRPIYGAFFHDWTARANAEMLYVSMNGTDTFGVDSVAKYEEALLAARSRGVKVKVLLLTNPHNPLGKCYTPDVLRAYMSLCQKYKLHLISDEVYAKSIFDNGKQDQVGFTSVYSLMGEGLIDEGYVHVFYGFSKDFGAGGIRLGCIISRNTEFVSGLMGISMFHWAAGPSTICAEGLLSDQVWLNSFHALSSKRLGEKYRYTTDVLRENQIPFYEGGTAGFFIWADFRSILPSPASLPPDMEDRDNPFAPERALGRLFQEAGVMLTTGEEFRSEEPGWFRIIFAQEREKLEVGLERAMSVVKKIKSDAEVNGLTNGVEDVELKEKDAKGKEEAPFPGQ